MQQDSLSRLVGRRRPKTSKEERVCPICFKDFAKAEHLARHYRSHTKEKPFPCPQCGRVYARKDTLLRHTRSHCRRDGSPEREAVSSPRIESTLEGLVAATPSDSATERPNINASSLDFSIPLAQPQPQRPIGDFQINESLDLSGIPGGELESGWISWLMDDKFDLDAVNATLLQATTGDFLAVDSLRPDEDPSSFESLEIGPQTTAPELAPSGDADHGTMDIRRKWHTHCGQAASSLISPDPVNDGNRIDHSQPDHNQIDETYRHELAKRLEQRLQTGILPSTTFLHLCLQAYFSHFHPLFPIVHEPSFVPSGQNAILLLSICSLGSLFLGSRRAIEHGISMFERLQKAALSSWDTTILQRPDSNIVTIQSALLGQTFGLLMGRPKDLMGIEAFHGSIIAFARRLRLFDHPASPELPTSVSSLSADELRLAWERWTCQEERKRTTLGIFILDAELAKMHHHEPLLRHAAERLPIIASDELFAADNANSWRVLVLQQIQRSETLTREQTCDWASNFQLSANLESISGIACECQAPFSSTHHMAQRCQEALFAWHDSHLSTASPGDDWAHPLKILWHSTFLLLFSNIDTLERACGRDGPEAAREAAGYARQWANSPEATRSILHAVCIRQHFESISIGAECSLWIPTCLYHCGIIWFSFGHFGEGKNRALPGQSFPEFELARVHLSEIVVGELNGSLDAGRKAVNQVFRIIGLLQSIRHWKLSLSLASTLLALVEGQDNGF